LAEVECAEVREDLQLSRRRADELQKSLVACSSSSSNQASLDYTDSDADDETFVFSLLLNIHDLHCESEKKQDIKLLPITSPNIN